MADAQRASAAQILDAIRDFYGLKSDAALARKFQLSEGSAVGNWRRRDSVDVNIIVRHCPEIDLDKLLREGVAVKKKGQRLYPDEVGPSGEVVGTVTIDGKVYSIVGGGSPTEDDGDEEENEE